MTIATSTQRLLHFVRFTRQGEGDAGQLASSSNGRSVARVRKRIFRSLQTAARIFKKRTVVTVNGRKFKAPVVDGEGVSIDEPWMIRLLQKLIRPGEGAFVDVGANMGQTMLALRSCHDVPYLGFEPNPACVYYARELINCNQLHGCVLFPVGLGEINEVRHLFTRRMFDTCGTIVSGFRTGADSQPVSIFRGDDVLGGYPGAIQMVKVDAEDGELEALAGLEATLKRHSPYVLCEILPVYDERTGVGAGRLRRQCQLLSFVRNLGYHVLRVQTDETLVSIDQIEIHDDLAKTNYLFVPSSRPLALQRDGLIHQTSARTRG